MSLKKEKIYLIDGSGYIFRAYHALPPLSRPDGTPVGAVYGFVNMLFRLWKTIKNHPLLVVFDASRITFRQNIYPEYKANRGETPEDLIPQFSIIREACKAFNLPYVEDKNFEADDLIASYANAYSKTGRNVVIISSDKDLMQLVNDSVSMYDPMKSKPIGYNEVVEKFGVPPSKVIDVQSLAGDSTDNIPGVPGIGIKTAALLIQQFGTLENLLNNADTIPQTKRREKLMASKEAALISKKLVTLSSTAPLPINLEKILPVEELLTNQAQLFLEKQNFTTLIKRFGFAEKPVAHKEHLTNSSLTPPSTEIKKEQEKQSALKTDIITSKDQLESWVKNIHYAGCVALYIQEENFRENSLIGISLSIPYTKKSAYIPISHKVDLLEDYPHTQLTMDIIQPYLSTILSNPSILKIAHNIKEIQHILHHYGLKIVSSADTMLISYLVNSSVHNHSLSDVAKQYCDYAISTLSEVTETTGKKKKRFEAVSIEKAAHFCSEKSFVVSQLFEKLFPLLPRHKSTFVYETIERPLADVLFSMETKGILINTHRLKTIHQELDEKIKNLELEVFEEAGFSFNLASPQQLSDVLFEKLAIPFIGKKGKSGYYSTSAAVLEKLVSQEYTIANSILLWRQLIKLQSTYTTALINQVNAKTNRIHTSYSMASTSTGRLSSSHPNLQNIPIRTKEGRQIRKAFIAPSGYTLISFDYSQIELRLLAHMADIPPLIQAFKNGADIHAKTASEVLKLPLEQITPDIRRRAKAINFGIIYGISAFGLGKQLNIPPKEAQAYIDAYFKSYPGIQSYMHEMISLAKDQGFVTTLLGRRCYIPEIHNKNYQIRQMAERQSINAPLQGTAADIIKKAMVIIHKKLPSSNIDASMLLQVHDELLFEVKKGQEDQLVSLIKPVMEQALFLKVPLTVDYGIGPTWDDCH